MLLRTANIIHPFSNHQIMTVFMTKCLITFLMLTIATNVKCENLLQHPSALSQQYFVDDNNHNQYNVGTHTIPEVQNQISNFTYTG